MGRPKGHRLTPEQRKKCRPRNPRGGRKKGAQPDRKGPIPKEHARTPQENAQRLDTFKATDSLITEQTLRRPVYKVRMPDGRTIIETLEPDKI